MNFNYLIEYVARQLHTIVRTYNRENRTLLSTICKRESFSDDEYFPFLSDSFFSLSDASLPAVFTNAELSYSVVGINSYICVAGPFLLTDVSHTNFSLPAISCQRQWLRLLPRCQLTELVNCLLLLHNVYNDKNITYEEVIEYNFFTDTISANVEKTAADILFHNMENSSLHNPYDQEIREVQSIREGNLEQLKKSWGEDYTGQVGTLARTALRSKKNIAIVLITLASRAAMDAGIHPETAHSLSDSYIRQVEEMTTPESAMHLGRKAEYHFATLVHEQNASLLPNITSASKQLDQIKNYIHSHLHEKIRLADMSSELYLTPSYLCSFFKKSEGITIGTYIWMEKLKLIKEQLIYSSLSFDEIACYFGFCSQSHLGQRFKSTTGMTLQEYRDKYGKRTV